MKTNVTLPWRMLSSFILYFMVSGQVLGQLTASASEYQLERQGDQLVREIAGINERATQLRTRARTADSDIKPVLVKEAGALEQQSLQKQVELYKVNYQKKL